MLSIMRCSLVSSVQMVWRSCCRLLMAVERSLDGWRLEWSMDGWEAVGFVRSIDGCEVMGFTGCLDDWEVVGLGVDR